MSEAATSAAGSLASSQGRSDQPRFDRALQALDRMDLERFLSECSALNSDGVAQALELSPVLCYELLRSASELLTQGAPSAKLREQRQSWAESLEAQPDVASRHRFLMEQLEHLTAPYRRKQAPINTTVMRAVRFIEMHSAEPISLSRVAREVGLARNYMSSLFHRETGVTMTEYIHRVRIRRALALLQSGSLAMTEIARMVGYGSYRHFHRRFCRLIGVSPTTFQRSPPSGATLESLVPAPRE
jgi:AraC-like DNA-binding protein